MAPRASWKGYLKLSLVSCPVRLYPATSASERISFNQLHKKTHNRINMKPVDPELGLVEHLDGALEGHLLQDMRDRGAVLLVQHLDDVRDMFLGQRLGDDDREEVGGEFDLVHGS